MWDVELGRLIWVIEEHSEPIYSIVLLDDRRFLSKTRTSAKMWDIESKEELPTDELPFKEESDEETYKRVEAKIELIEQCNRMNFFGDYAIKLYKFYEEAELYDDSYTKKLWLRGDVNICKKQTLKDRILMKKSCYILTYDKYDDLVVMDIQRKNTFVKFGKASLHYTFISSDGSKVVFRFEDRSYVYDVDNWTRVESLILNRDGKFVKLNYNNIPPLQEESRHILKEEALLFAKLKRENRLKNIRNITVFSDNDKTKAVLVDKMFSYMNLKEHLNEPIDLDWMTCEQDIDAVIVAPITTESWLGREINGIGVDSLFDVHPISVIDGGVTLVSAISEIAPMMIELHKMQMKHRIPSLIFVGQIGKKGADFFTTIRQIEDKLSTVAVVTQLPIGEGEQFEGLIDLIGMREFIWTEVDDYTQFTRDKTTEHEIRKELMPQALAYREKMLEQLSIVEGNEKLMEKFLEDREIDEEEIVEAIRVATLLMAVKPVFLGCISKDKGVRKLLDAVVEYLPSPSLSIEAKEMESRKTITVDANEAEPFVGVVFAQQTDPFVGELSMVRLYRGSLKYRSVIYNTTQNREEKATRLLKFHAIRREEVEEVVAGDMVSITGLKAKIGDTLCDLNHKVLLERIENREPLFLVKVVVNNKAQDKYIVSYAVKEVAKKNPLCRIFYDEHIFIYGENKLQLNQIVSSLMECSLLDVEGEEPQMVYYRTIKTALQKEYIYNGKKKFADISLRFEPQERRAGYKFVDEIKGGVVPKEFIYPINQGIQKALQEGIGDGFPMIDIKATLYNGSYHDVYSDSETFKRAGYEATKEVLKEGNFRLLEPIMKLNIKVESQEIRKVILTDISKRRGIACGRGGNEHNLGDIYVPLAEILDYDEELHLLSDGQASYEMVFERYEAVPEYLV